MKHAKPIAIVALFIVMVLPSVLFSTPLINTFDGTIYKRALSEDSPYYNTEYSKHYSTIDLIGFSVYSPGDVEINVMSWESTPEGINTDLNADGEIAYLDTYLYLFKNDGHLDASDLVASNNNPNDDSDKNSATDDGSLTYDDSYLKAPLGTGPEHQKNYILAIGAWDLAMEEILMGMNYAEPSNPTNPSEYIPIWGGTKNSTDWYENDHGDYRITFTGKVENIHLIQPVPEPDTFALFGLGFIGVVVLIRKKVS
ncbi:MAG: PEP-CTERM sorting domain-containing protein [Proteobacteria bacterium]|nr:PEP-CTERM sorting domain-containing protein [Pseudomonadota bacterium]